MASLESPYMVGFRDIMKTLPMSDHVICHEIQQIVAEARLALDVISASDPSGTANLPTANDISATPDRRNKCDSKDGQQELTSTQASQKPLTHSIGSKKLLPPPDVGILHLGAIHCKNIIPQLLKGLDHSASGLLVIPNSAIRYFSVSKAQDTTSPKIIFYANEIDEYDPLALGKPMLEQNNMIFQKGKALKEKVKEWLLDNQEINSQIVFAGFASGAAVAQIAAIRLLFDNDLALYKTPHRVISIVFGDVRIFGSESISQLDGYGFDHRDHVVFCSTESYLPINVYRSIENEQSYKGYTVAIPIVDHIGRRVEFSLESIQKHNTEPSGDLSKAATIKCGSPLCKLLSLDVYKTQVPIALDAYEHTKKFDKKSAVDDAIAALEEYFREFRLKFSPNTVIKCTYDERGDSNDFGIPSSRLTCSVQNIQTHASIQLFFNVFWTDDVHEINLKFIDQLKAHRLNANKYQYPIVRSEEKVKKTLETKTPASRGFRYRFANWAAFFHAQIDPRQFSPVEAASRYINPFFDESVYISIKGGKYKFGLDLASEVLMKKMLSHDANDQRLIYDLYGPINENTEIDSNRSYFDLKTAKMLFRAPLTGLAEASLCAMIGTLFNVQVPKQTVKELLSIDDSGTKQWGDFTLKRLDSFQMNHFTSEAKLPDLANVIIKANEAHDCSYALPSKECPKIALLNIPSPFWSRMYRVGDVYLGFRGYSSKRNVVSEIEEFCKELVGRRYETTGSGTILEVYTPTAFGDSFFSYKYYFYIIILQDPPFPSK